MTFGDLFRQYAGQTKKTARLIYGPAQITEVTYYGVLSGTRFVGKKTLDILIDAVLPDPEDDFARAKLYSLYLQGRMLDEEKKGNSSTSDLYTMVTLINVTELVQSKEQDGAQNS